MSLNLWLCSRITRRIEKYEERMLKFKHAITILQGWIRRDKRELKARIKNLTREEYMDYGLQNGFIDEEGFKTIRRKRK